MKELIRCFGCNKEFLRDRRHLNENIKLGLHNYCSLYCLSKNHQKREWFVCANHKCHKKFQRISSRISPKNYCSCSCAVSANNILYPKRPAPIKTCLVCGVKFKKENKMFCSTKCKYEGQKLDGDALIKEIKEFCNKHGRIPFKKELKHYRSVRTHFGTWNNAIQFAGFKPNPVMFANKHIANDGHRCDSLSEKIIDDWLYARKIDHIINYPYPGKKGFTVDFKVKDYWIEFFGLSGEHKRYDELKDEKIRLAKVNNLKLIKVYPSYLFDENKLNQILGKLTKQLPLANDF